MIQTEDLNELEKLKIAALLMKAMTHGRLELRPGVLGVCYVHPLDSANIGINMAVRPNIAMERYDVTFHAQIRRMGDTLDSAGLRELMLEVQEAYALLAALDMSDYHPSQEDMQAFRDFIDRQQEPKPTQQTGPGLGQTL